MFRPEVKGASFAVAEQGSCCGLITLSPSLEVGVGNAGSPASAGYFRSSWGVTSELCEGEINTCTGFPWLCGLGAAAPHRALPCKRCCYNAGSSCTGQRVCFPAAFSLADVHRGAVSKTYLRMWVALQEGQRALGSISLCLLKHVMRSLVHSALHAWYLSLYFYLFILFWLLQ